jgi:TrmH family RNA methyltransferase
MVSKNTLKIIKSLAAKKGRETHKQFVVEGYKSVCELLETNLELVTILMCRGLTAVPGVNCEVISSKEMQQASSLKTAPGYLAVFKIPQAAVLPQDGRILVLDGIQDPGNLGTILRLCDWFTISHIVCSENTVDCFNPKAVQASMASIGRATVHYTNLENYLAQLTIPIMVTAMQGTSIYKEPLPVNAALVLGNESHGVSTGVMKLGTPYTIPQYGKHTTESLNVATAAAITLGEWLRSTET